MYTRIERFIPLLSRIPQPPDSFSSLTRFKNLRTSIHSLPYGYGRETDRVGKDSRRETFGGKVRGALYVGGGG
jgi:hypothetical protein